MSRSSFFKTFFWGGKSWLMRSLPPHGGGSFGFLLVSPQVAYAFPFRGPPGRRAAFGGREGVCVAKVVVLCVCSGCEGQGTTQYLCQK
jgi:hypothetical protein